MPAVVTKDKLHAIVERLKGGSALIAESTALGFTHNGPLRGALRELLGVEGYNELMMAKRPVALARAPRSETGAIIRERPDDTGLPLIACMLKSEGWTWRRVAEHEPWPRKVEIKKGGKSEGTITIMDTGRQLLVMQSPDGIEYTYAEEYEKADLLCANSVLTDAPPVRFVRWENSTLRRRAEKAEKAGEEQERRGEAGIKRRQARVKRAGGIAAPEAPASVPAAPTPEPPAPQKRTAKRSTAKAKKAPAPGDKGPKALTSLLSFPKRGGTQRKKGGAKKTMAKK